MNKKLLFLSLLCGTISLYSQTDSTKIAFIAYWSKGDRYDFKVSKIQSTWENDILTKKDSSQYIANFEVLDSTSESYKIQWTYKNNMVSTFQEKAREYYQDKDAVNHIMSKYDTSKIIYETNELGEFIQILNWQQLSSVMKELLDEMEKSLAIKTPEKAKQLKQAMAPLIQIYSSKEGIEQIAMKELQYFHFPFGVEYDITTPIEYEQELPSMIGGNPIIGNAVLTFEEVDFENAYCVLKEEVFLNPEETKRQTTKLLDKMELNDSQVTEVMENAVFDIRDLSYYQYFYYPGVPYYVHSSRNVILNMEKMDYKRIDEVSLELIYE